MATPVDLVEVGRHHDHAGDDATVRGDPDALDRVLRNLIEHALAPIDPTGRINVELRRRNGFAEAIVADDGPGVPEHEVQRIFERFVRLEPGKPGRCAQGDGRFRSGQADRSRAVRGGNARSDHQRELGS